jgi:outer membrane protein assembly factor BamB
VNKARALSAAVLALAVTGLLSCKSNHAPDVPAVPAGPEYCLRDTTYTFTTVVSDPDGDSMGVRFDWGDSTASHWVGWFASGDTVASSHTWSDTGNFEVRVSAQDRRRTSALSEGHSVQVGIRLPPDTPGEPQGPRFGGRDTLYDFKAGADHPDWLYVAIRFSWGDGDTSDWSDFVLPGGPVEMGHAWSTPDTYLVRAQAKDTFGLTSQWSEPHTIVIYPPDTMLKWRVQIAVRRDFYMYSSPAIGADGTVYVGSSDNALYAVSQAGTVKWRYLTGGPVVSSPAIAVDGTVYVGSSDSCLYAVGPDGVLAWRYATRDYVRSSPAIAADGTVYFGSSDGCLYALNPSGTLKWSFLTGAAVTSSPAIAADGTVYFSSGDHCVYALTQDGSPKWQYVGETGTVFASPAIGSDGTIYCGARSDWEGEGSLCAFNPDGSLKWSFSSGGGIRFSPAIAVDGTIYFGSDDWWWGGCGFYGLNSDGTHKLYSEPSGFHPSSSPAINAVGTIYIGSYDSCLYAFYPDGTTKWRYQTGGYVGSSPTIGSDGTIYFTSDDGYLYALKGMSPLANSPWPKFHRDLRNTGCSDEAGWSRLRMVGAPILLPDSAGFMIRVINDGTVEASVDWLEFYDAPESAYMRDFFIDADHCGYPIPDGMPGTGPGDTVRFTAPVTIAPNGSQLSELYFGSFCVDEVAPPYVQANVHVREFVFRFSDGSEITVNP